MTAMDAAVGVTADGGIEVRNLFGPAVDAFGPCVESSVRPAIDDYDDRRREPQETPDDKLKLAILKLGEVDPVEELERLEKDIRAHIPRNIQIVSEAFRLGVTEQPYKIPFYAALLYLLHAPSDPPIPGDIPLGRLVLEDFWRGFQSYVDKVAWTETRLCIHFFAHLTVAGLISPESMLALVRSFTAVLDEFGVSYGRGKRAAQCAGEAMIIAGHTLKSHSPEGVDEVINAIQIFYDSTKNTHWLVAPTARVSTQTLSSDLSVEMIGMLLAALASLNDSGFTETAGCIPQPYLAFPSIESAVTNPYDLPLVLVPPEAMELDGMSGEAGEDTQVKKEEWPEFHLRLYPPDVSPEPTSPAGYIIRSALMDIVDIFEVNRKECARLLLEYPKWNLPGTFKPKPGATNVPDPLPGKQWQLESTIIESVLGSSLALPEAHRKFIYYTALITELCKLSPSTVGPAVGKAFRKLYQLLSDGLDVETSRRFAEWFALHMSNFGFQWVWKEWVPDLTLHVQHPRRAFMRRAIEFEIRLAYHDRILKTLPEAMQSPDAFVIAEQPPAPAYEYEEPSHPRHDAAQAVLNLFRGRATADDVITHIDVLRSSLESSEESPLNVDSTIRSIVVQSLLHIGSRSFSHFLNAIERYLPLLRNLAGISTNATGSTDSEAKSDILKAAATFWRYNRQMVGIVFDKLMQYQIVEPSDVVAWTFMNGVGLGQIQELAGPMNLSAFEWDLLRAALDKANGRVAIARRKIATLRKEDDEARARVKAGATESMEVDAEKEAEAPVADSPALTTALKAQASLLKEQRATLSRTLEGFVSCLAPSETDRNVNPHARTVITEDTWDERLNWGRDEWNAWETWGWYRQFCRAYSPYLRTYTKTLETVSFSRFEGVEDPAAELMKQVWSIATGQE